LCAKVVRGLKLARPVPIARVAGLCERKPAQTDMGDQVERALEETVPLLRQVRKLKLLSGPEIESVVRRRRDHEYALRRPAATRAEFMQYAAFERETTEVLRARAEGKNLPEKRARSITMQQAARVNLVYSRAIRKFKGDDTLYLQYARHCIATGSRRAAEKVLARAIAHRGDSEKVWLAAAAFHFEACGDIKVARAISQRGLRALKTSKLLWREYFRMELAYLAKLVARRTTIGMAVPEGATSEDGAVDDVPGAGAGDAKDSEPGNEGTVVAATDPNKLAFWDGGVPFAVFRSALGTAHLDVTDASAYLQLAASMPFSPPQLLKRLAADVAARMDVSSSPGAEALLSRNAFDVACARLRRKRSDMEVALAGAKDAQESLADECVTADIAKVVGQLAEQFVDDVEKIESVGEEGTANYAAVAEVLGDFLRAVGECVADAASVERLRLRCEEVLSKSQADVRAAAEDNASMPALQDLSSSNDWSLFIDKCGASAFDDEARTKDIRAAFSNATNIPFRTADQEKICVLWFCWERDALKLRDAYGSVLSVPPVSIAVLRGAISAEFRIAGPKTETIVPSVRKLFTQASRHVDAKNDIDLWLEYFRFERDIAGDPSIASTISWSAKRTLNEPLASLFEERCTLMNLS
jgi:hypothetical protein